MVNFRSAACPTVIGTGRYAFRLTPTNLFNGFLFAMSITVTDCHLHWTHTWSPAGLTQMFRIFAGRQPSCFFQCLGINDPDGIVIWLLHQKLHQVDGALGHDRFIFNNLRRGSTSRSLSFPKRTCSLYYSVSTTVKTVSFFHYYLSFQVILVITLSRGSVLVQSLISKQ
jgi:hypothetical protein